MNFRVGDKKSCQSGNRKLQIDLRVPKEKMGHLYNRFEEKKSVTKSLTVRSMEWSQSLFVIGTESSV